MARARDEDGDYLDAIDIMLKAGFPVVGLAYFTAPITLGAATLMLDGFGSHKNGSCCAV